MSALILSIIILPIVGTFSQSIQNISYTKKTYVGTISAENILERTKYMITTKEVSYLEQNKNNNATISELLEIANFQTDYNSKELLYTLVINQMSGSNIKNTFVFSDNNIVYPENYPKTNNNSEIYNTEIKDIEINFNNNFTVLKGEQFVKEINNICNIEFNNITYDIYMELKVFTQLDYSKINILNNSIFNIYINVFDENTNTDLSKIKYKGNGVMLISKNKQTVLENNYSISVYVYDKKTLNLIKTIGWIF